MEEKMRNAIRKALESGAMKYAIYPFGVQARIFKWILNNEFGIEEALIIDNGKCEESGIKRFEQIEPSFWRDCVVFLVSDHSEIFFQLRSQALRYVPCDHILDVLLNEWVSGDAMQKIFEGEGKVKVFFNPLSRQFQDRTVETLGNNTGNIVYVESMREQLGYDIEAQLTTEWMREKLGRKNVISIMPASNFVAEYAVWCENLIPILEDTDIQFTFAGLGAQAAFDETPKDVIAKLTHRQKYFFKLVSEHAEQIGVRGEFTAECLNVMGIRNVEIIGCPSFFQYKDKYPLLASPTAGKILYTADNSKKDIHALAGSEGTVISQTHEDGQKKKEIIFYDFKQWNDFIDKSKFTFAFGSRFHGNMMALRNGIPTLWIAHDWRTLELAQYLGLPYILYKECFKKVKSVEELFEFCDYSQVYKRYPSLNRTYCEFIRRNFDENFRK